VELFFPMRPEIVNILGHVTPVQGQATVRPDPILRPDRAQHEFIVECYGTVLRDGGRFRMWYSSSRRAQGEHDGKAQCQIGYAESSDAITWTRPRLGLVEAFGSRDNNLTDMGLCSPSVFIDPDSPPSHRYRAQGYTQTDYAGTCLKPGMAHGYYTMHSADGLHWELDSDKPTWPVFADEISAFYHPVQRRGIVMLKREWYNGGIKRRGFWEAQYANGQYSADTSALIPDEFDDLAAQARGQISGDYYHMGFMPAGRSSVGFLSHFRHERPHHPGNPMGFFGCVDVGLVYQHGPRDRWVHFWGRPDFIRHGQHPWMAQCVYTSTVAIDLGDEQGIVISATPMNHGYGYRVQDNQLFRGPLMSDWLQNDLMVLGLATWRRDRLMGFHSDGGGHIELNLGPVAKPSELRLNFQSHHSGRVRIEIFDSKRKIIATSADLTGDHLSLPVPFGDSTALPAGEGPLQMWVHLESATLWAYELRPLTR
jgi:hypothetical protein